MDGENMDAQQARRRLLEGGYFVALGVPPGVEFGIDLKSYETGPHFKGVKMIPAGLHFAHFGTGEGEKQGIFFRSSPGSVAATQWDASAEDLVDAQTCLPDGALRALRESVLRLEMDANLGPHDFEQEAAWLTLTDCVTDSVLERCGVPVGAKVLAGSSAAEPGEPGGGPAISAAALQDGTAESEGKGGKGGAGAKAAAAAGGASGMEIVPHFPHVGRVARYSGVPGRAEASASSSAAPEDVTKRNMDGSESLRRLIASDFGGSWVELLGELQLSFVLFVSLSSLGGFRHWQALSAQLCRCGDALKTDPALFTAFIRMLHAHLKLVPEDFFDVELSKDNFLVPCLSALLQNVLPDETLAPPLQDAGKRLLNFLQQRFGLFLPGSGVSGDDGPDSNRKGGASASGTVSALQTLPAPPPRSGGWGVGGAGGVEGGAGMPGTEGLSLMHLELSEEDQPAVVPYEEVLRALGTDVMHLSNAAAINEQRLQQPSATRGHPSHSDDVGDGAASVAGVEKSADDARAPDPEGAGAGARVLSTPSAEHAQRWRDIDQLLDSASPAAGRVSAPPKKTIPDAGEGAGAEASAPAGDSNDSARSHQSSGSPARATLSPLPAGVTASLLRDPDDSSSSSGSASRAAPPRAAAAPVAMSAAAAAAAKKYPLLFAAIRSNEDVLMAAARLLASAEEGDERGESGTGEAAAAAAVVQEAVKFLEDEVEASEDGAAAVWQSSSPA